MTTELLIVWRGPLDENDENLIKKYKNKLFFDKNFVQKERFFYLKKKLSSNLVRFQYKINTLQIDAELGKELDRIVHYSLQRIDQISPEPAWFHQEQVRKAIGGLKSITLEFSYKEQFSIFEFTARLFVRLLMGHYLTNGNKRLATAFLYELLWFFGYMFRWTSNFYTKHKQHEHENKITYFAKKSQGGKDSEILLEVIKWIKENVSIKDIICISL